MDARTDHPGGGRSSAALDRRTMTVAAVVLLGAIMSILDTTVINVAIDRLAVDFSASLTTIQWVVTGYTLALAAVIPVTGWAADRFGTKRIYLTSLALFMLGSTLCAFAWSAGSLIAFRVLQGAGGGMIMPVAMTILTRTAGPQRMGRVMGLLGVPLLVAPILGPILGAGSSTTCRGAGSSSSTSRSGSSRSRSRRSCSRAMSPSPPTSSTGWGWPCSPQA